MKRARTGPIAPLDAQLAQRIVGRLVKEKLLTPGEAKRLAEPLAEGRLAAEDWQLPLEVSHEREEP